MKIHQVATSMVLSLMLISTPSWANILDDTSKAIGSAIGSFGKGVATGALPDSNIVVSDIEISDGLIMRSQDNHGTTQVLQNIQVSDSELKYIQTHTVIKDDVLMVLDNCDDRCYQAITRILVKTGGAGLGGVYAKTAVDGIVRMESSNSSKSEQYGHDIRIGNDSW